MNFINRLIKPKTVYRRKLSITNLSIFDRKTNKRRQFKSFGHLVKACVHANMQGFDSYTITL